MNRKIYQDCVDSLGLIIQVCQIFTAIKYYIII